MPGGFFFHPGEEKLPGCTVSVENSTENAVVWMHTPESGGTPLPAFEHHVFVCCNARPEGAPRPSCTQDGKGNLYAKLKSLVKAASLEGKVRVNRSDCLDQCEHGPVVVVYPEAVWYGNVMLEDAAEIVAEHLVAGRPVERLRVAEECLNSKSCPHRG
jgi:(2Fe-2S) ferredoxin